MPKKNDKNELRKTAIIWSVVDEPGLDSGALRTKAYDLLDRRLPFYYSDFCAAIWPLVTRGVINWFPMNYKDKNKSGRWSSKHRVVFTPGPRIAYGKKRWPKNLVENKEGYPEDHWKRAEKVEQPPPPPPPPPEPEYKSEPFEDILARKVKEREAIEAAAEADRLYMEMEMEDEDDL